LKSAIIKDEEKEKRQIKNREWAVRINPEETLCGTWNISPIKGSYFRLVSNEWDITPTKGSYVGRDSKEMKIELMEVPGVYRMFILLSGREDGGQISREWAPLEECVSNEFEIIEKE